MNYLPSIKMNLLRDKTFTSFVVRFLVIFSLCYFGTLAVIGLAAPGDMYSPFIARYLDFVSWIKTSLVKGTAAFASIFGYETYEVPNHIIRIKGGTGVRIAYSCVGYGVYSFWFAYAMASHEHFKRKLAWAVMGILLLWLINVVRIGLLLIALNRNWPMPLGLDHHTWFNIVAYIFIFLMILLFERGRGGLHKQEQKAG